MTTANSQHALPGRLSQAWRGFRHWRRTRPFWGGLFTALAGVEIFSTTQMSLNGLTFQTGPTGFLSWLIPAILVACGMLLWFSPQQRMFYAIVAAVTAVFSLIGINLGGFFIGMLLGMVGSALGFAWVPKRPPAAAPTDATAPTDAAASVDQAGTTDEAGPRNADASADDDSTEVLPAVGPDGRPQGGPHRDPKLFAVTLVLLGVSAAGALAVRDESPAQAAPAKPCPTPSATRTPTPSPSASRPADGSPSPGASLSPGASPSPERKPDGNLITDIIDGIGDILAPGDGEAPASAAPTPSPQPQETGPTATPTGRPTPGTSASPGRPDPDDDGCAAPEPTEPADVEPGKPLPKVAAEPGQPRVAAEPSKLTGSKVTMTGLRFAGIVDLPTDGGTLKTLKFSMKKAVTDDFLLRAKGPGGRTTRYATDELTVERAEGSERDVAFYCTRFSGKLLGVEITLEPNLPFPDGIPVTFPVPVTFTDPEMELAFVRSDILTATPSLDLDLA
ncbi:DUF6114 domain-containing protein [Micromonospora okii]|uniref:DUF6114 domain-containing protein n=1 Tax=Micromonospora okii TaxID=1182970 RepID=UPI001E440735|nr:DUF6114 domain-containing protein [Micromonospora okii]